MHACTMFRGTAAITSVNIRFTLHLASPSTSVLGPPILYQPPNAIAFGTLGLERPIPGTENATAVETACVVSSVRARERVQVSIIAILFMLATLYPNTLALASVHLTPTLTHPNPSANAPAFARPTPYQLRVTLPCPRGLAPASIALHLRPTFISMNVRPPSSPCSLL